MKDANTTWQKRALDFVLADIANGAKREDYDKIIAECIANEDYEGAQAIKDAFNTPTQCKTLACN